jgi:opacity protein-like surface antigen
LPRSAGSIILSACALLAAAAPASAQQDAGASYNLVLKAPLSGDWFLLSRSNLATRDNFGDSFLGYTGASIGRQLSKQFSLRLGYRRAWFRFSEDWQPEDRLMLEGYYAARPGGFRVSNRLRAELRSFDWRDDDIRLRNEIVVEAPWALTRLKLKPYLEEEVFYSTNAGRFEANWLGGGLAWRPAKGLKLKLGYRWNRFRAGDDWANRNVLVTGLNVFF